MIIGIILCLHIYVSSACCTLHLPLLLWALGNEPHLGESQQKEGIRKTSRNPSRVERQFYVDGFTINKKGEADRGMCEPRRVSVARCSRTIGVVFPSVASVRDPKYGDVPTSREEAP